MLTPEQLGEIEQRVSALREHATAGDWFYDGTDAVQVFTEDDSELVASVWGESGSTEERALGEFIAHARQDVPALLAEVERANELLLTVWAARRIKGLHAETLCAHHDGDGDDCLGCEIEKHLGSERTGPMVDGGEGQC